ncbi:MAG: TonB-dependent receptor [Bacteroidetes bacterium]|nr:TonB-dependent receptor [Bacteroidota bacterium]
MIKHSNDSLAALDLPDLELRLYTQSVDLNLETRNRNGFTGVIGISGLKQDNQYGGQRFFVPNYILYNSAAYTTIRWRKMKWEVEAGARVDYREQSVYRNIKGAVVQNDYQFTNPGLSAGLLFKQDSSISWTLNAGTAYRPPSINEWFSNGLHHGTATFETGDSTLGVEKAYNVIGGVRIQKRKLAVDASIYYLYIKDYIYLIPDESPVLTISGAFPSFAYSHVDASFKGVDLSIDWDITRGINLRSRNSLVFAWNHTGNRYLELVPSPRFDQLLSYRFNDTKSWKELTLGLSALIVAEQWRYDEGRDYIPPPPAYVLPGFEASATFSHAGQEIRMGLSVSNLFNTSYREYLNRFRYYADETGRNITLRLTVPLSFKTAAHDHEH